MCEKAPHISIKSKICDTCRKKLSKESHIPEPLFSEPDPPSPSNPPTLQALLVLQVQKLKNMNHSTSRLQQQFLLSISA
jgi:hypothetical protein